MRKEEVLSILRSREEKKIGKKKFEKVKWISPPKERNKKFKFRILPYTEQGDFTTIRYIHWINDKPVDCLQTLTDCPICEVLSKYPRKEVGRMLANGNAYFNIQLPEEPNNVYLLRMSENFLQWLLEQSTMLELDFLDPVNGHDIIVYRKTDRGAFEKAISPHSRPIAPTDEEIKEILSKTVNLDTYFKEPSEEKIAEIELIAEKLQEDLEAKYNNLKVENMPEEIELNEDLPVSENTKKQASNDAGLPSCFGQFKGITHPDCVECDFSEDCIEKTDLVDF